MPAYSYRARDGRGRLVRGVAEAPDALFLARRLRDSGYLVVDVKPRKFLLRGRAVRLRAREQAVFLRQLATMIQAGLPILRAFSALERETKNKKFGGVLRQVGQRLSQGSTLAEAMESFPRTFPPLVTSMVAAGEVGGVLEEVLERLARHFEREHALGEKVRAAMAYPLVVLTIAFLALFVLTVFVLPVFESLVGTLGAELPLSTRVVLSASAFLRRHLVLVLLTVVGVGAILRAAFGWPKVKEKRDRYVLKLPVVGPLVTKIVVSRFCRTLSTLLAGGVPLLQALEAVKRVVGNAAVVQSVEWAEKSLREGRGISGPLAACPAFPPLVAEMVKVGEETGALDEMLERIAVYYDLEVEAAVEKLGSLVEPVLILLLGGIVGFIVVSTLLPIMTLAGSIG